MLKVWGVTPMDSFTWKGILKIFSQVNYGMKRHIGSGRNDMLWFDSWTSVGPFYMEDDVKWDHTEVNMRDIIDENRNWNLSKLKYELPTRIR